MIEYEISPGLWLRITKASTGATRLITARIPEASAILDIPEETYEIQYVDQTTKTASLRSVKGTLCIHVHLPTYKKISDFFVKSL